MPKVSGLKILDEAVVPVVCIFAAKLGGFFLANFLFDLNWTFGLNQFSLTTPFFRYLDQTSLQVGTEISTLLIFCTLGAGFGWVLFRAHSLHLSHLDPKKAKNLVLAGWDRFFVDSHELYHQAAVWFALSCYILIETFWKLLVGEVSLWMFSFCLTLVFALAWILVADITRETEALKARKKVNNQS